MPAPDGAATTHSWPREGGTGCCVRVCTAALFAVLNLLGRGRHIKRIHKCFAPSQVQPATSSAKARGTSVCATEDIAGRFACRVFSGVKVYSGSVPSYGTNPRNVRREKTPPARRLPHRRVFLQPHPPERPRDADLGKVAKERCLRAVEAHSRWKPPLRLELVDQRASEASGLADLRQPQDLHGRRESLRVDRHAVLPFGRAGRSTGAGPAGGNTTFPRARVTRSDCGPNPPIPPRPALRARSAALARDHRHAPRLTGRSLRPVATPPHANRARDQRALLESGTTCLVNVGAKSWPSNPPVVPAANRWMASRLPAASSTAFVTTNSYV